MVAVHPWDIDGASRAGMGTAWLDRSEGHYPSVFREPTFTVSDLEQLPDLLA
jgi:2-haloacid dehalogenase